MVSCSSKYRLTAYYYLIKNRGKSKMQLEGKTVNFLGDSITQGSLLNEINYETVYWNLLRKTILNVRNYVPVKRDL